MPALFEYLRNITYYLLFAALVTMMAGKHRQHVRLIMGLVLLLLIIQPLNAFVKGPGLPVTDWYTGMLPVAANGSEAGYANTYTAALHTAFEEQLTLQLTALLRQNGYELMEAEFTYAPDMSRIEGVSLAAKAAPSVPARQAFIRIEPVRIGTASGGSGASNDENALSIKKIIASFYNLPAEHIHVKLR